MTMDANINMNPNLSPSARLSPSPSPSLDASVGVSASPNRSAPAPAPGGGGSGGSLRAAPRRTGMTRKGFGTLTWMHAKLLFRDPGVAVWIALPLALCVLFGEIPSFQHPASTLGGRSVMDVYVPTFAVMVPLFLAFGGLPGTMASFREKNALRRFSVSPVPPAGMLAALLAVIAALAAAGVLLIIGVATLAFHVSAPGRLGAVIGSFVLGAAAFMALGLVIAALAPTNGVANGFGIPLLILNFFFSGLYVPLQELPRVLQQIAEYVPAGAVTASWQGQGALWQHLLVLAGYTLVGDVAAARLFRWE